MCFELALDRIHLRLAACLIVVLPSDAQRNPESGAKNILHHCSHHVRTTFLVRTVFAKYSHNFFGVQCSRTCSHHERRSHQSRTHNNMHNNNNTQEETKVLQVEQEDKTRGLRADSTLGVVSIMILSSSYVLEECKQSF